MAKRDGVFRKFNVSRTDGTDQKPGDKHFNCVYFVLDISHDRFAAAALRAYAKACQIEMPELAKDVADLATVNEIETGVASVTPKQFPPACYGPVVKIAMETKLGE
jgi:hypothetical protein